MLNFYKKYFFRYSGHKNIDYRIEMGILSSNNEIVSGSEDGNLYIWDLVSGLIITRLELNSKTKYVHSIATHPTKQTLLAAANDRLYVFQNENEIHEE